MTTIALYHEVLANVDRKQALAVMPTPVAEFSVDVTRDLLQGDIKAVDWHETRRREEAVFRTTLRPALERDADANIVYFGAAPIPLAIRLGHLIGTWRRTDVRLHHHERKDWSWSAEGRTIQLNARLPSTLQKSDGDVIVRLAITQPIDVEATARLLPTPAAEVDITAVDPRYDIVASPEDVAAIVAVFQQALDAVAAYVPNARAIHLFAAVPVGVAFKLGAAVNSTTTPPIYLYQYNRLGDERFIRCFQLQGDTPPITRVVTDTERAKAAELRILWQEQIEKLKKTIAETEMLWYEPLLGPIPWPKLLGLPKLGTTTLLGSRISSDTAVPGGFRYDPIARRWSLDDALLSNFARRFASALDAARSARLFLLHETIHHDAQGLTAHTAPQVGRFPKVLEDLDYHADAFAIIHEYQYMKRWHEGEHDTVGQRFTSIIQSALDSFWAFDDDEPRGRMQVRRVHRYLIWYWQLLRLGHCATESEALLLLADRPFIELAGPRLVTSNERVYFLFDRALEGPLELGLIHDGGLRRFADGPAAALTSMLLGFDERNGDRVKQALAGILDQLRA